MQRATSSGKEKILNATSSVSGFSGIFSSWAVCHNICTAAIAVLSLLGITVTGMPLLFLQKIATPLWIVAVGIFLTLLGLKAWKKGCLSTNALMINGGLIMAGTPFLAQQALFFRIAGAAVIAAAMARIVMSRLK